MSHPYLFVAAAAATAALAGPAAAAPQLLASVQAAAGAAPAAPPTRTQVSANATASFQQIDTNKDGALSKAEVDAAQVRRQQRVTAAETQRVTQQFNRLDTDKSGQLSLAEFRAVARQVKVAPNASTEAMKEFDTNSDGKITADEYRQTILGSFDRVDTNKDGTISDAEEKAAARTASR